MALLIDTAKTCATAWLDATSYVDKASGHEAHNVMIDIATPLAWTEADRHIVSTVDSFLREHKALPLQAIANTIFPEDLYRRHGVPDFYKVYLEKVYPRIRRQNDWGRYFERMIRHQNLDGSTINPLDELIKKLRKHVHGDQRTFRHIYELGIFDPVLDMTIHDPSRDAGRAMNRPCLSFLSFKLDRSHRLLLTALYRNHYYIERLLGNLIGLSHLLAFVAEQVNIETGSLTVISTHAEIDIRRWNRTGVRKLLETCRATRQKSAAA